jgi:hypothetical protein
MIILRPIPVRSAPSPHLGFAGQNPGVPQDLLELKHRRRAEIDRDNRRVQIAVGIAQEQGARQHFVAMRCGIEQFGDSERTVGSPAQRFNHQVHGGLTEQDRSRDGRDRRRASASRNRFPGRFSGRKPTPWSRSAIVAPLGVSQPSTSIRPRILAPSMA